MHRSCKNEAVPNILSGGAIVAWSKSIKRIADAVDVIEQFADEASPGFCAGKCVVRDEIQASRDVSLQMYCKRFVAGTVVRTEYGNTALIIVPPIAVHARLKRPIRAQDPIRVEAMFNPCSRMQRIRRVVIRINQGWRARCIQQIE